jgi:hypothetical protein
MMSNRDARARMRDVWLPCNCPGDYQVVRYWPSASKPHRATWPHETFAAMLGNGSANRSLHTVRVGVNKGFPLTLK